MIEPVHIGLGITIFLSTVSGIAWAMKLEAKANRSKDEIVILKDLFHAHETNKGIHHNADAFIEFEKRIDLRFEHLGKAVEKVEKYVEDIDHKMEQYIKKRS